jgi:spermidine/putrescine transport system substrate-binding protein
MERRDFLKTLFATTGGIIIGPSLLAACGGATTKSSTGLIIGTPDSPVTLPLVGEPIADGLANEGGTIEILNWADYTNPEVIADFEKAFGVTVKQSIYDNEDAAIAKLRNGTLKPDLIIGMTDTALARLMAGELIQPLNHSYIPNKSNLITGLQNPYYDLGAQYTMAQFIYGNGIGYRRDRIDPSEIASQGNDAMWNTAYSGKLGVADSARDIISLALFQAGVTDVNTGDADILAAAQENLIRLRTNTSPKVDVLSYQEIPAGNRDIAYIWSGDILLAPFYLPEGTSADVLGFWYPENTITANDFLCIPKTSAKPVAAHQFINYLLDNDVAAKNQSYVGYQPALTNVNAEALINAGAIPETLIDAVIDDAKYQAGKRIVSLNPETDALWNDVWTTFTAG